MGRPHAKSKRPQGSLPRYLILHGATISGEVVIGAELIPAVARILPRLALPVWVGPSFINFTICYIHSIRSCELSKTVRERSQVRAMYILYYHVRHVTNPDHSSPKFSGSARPRKSKPRNPNPQKLRNTSMIIGSFIAAETGLSMRRQYWP